MKTIDQIYVLVACEFSQVISTAFANADCHAFSCDLIPSKGGHPERHIIQDAKIVVQGNNIFQLENGNYIFIKQWDLIIAHPPCTMLARSSAVLLAQGIHTIEQVHEARKFLLQMYNAKANHICVENPIPLKIANLPPYTQLIQPYDFGHNYSKATCLWLKNLPPLLPTHARYQNPKQWHNRFGSKEKQKRSISFQGIANAMVQQWLPVLIDDS